MHARCETIERLPTFAPAFATRRGILAVQTFNEGEEVSPSKTVQHVLTQRDGKPLGIAVIWEQVNGRDNQPLLTFVMVTTPPNPLIETITDRMPAVIPTEHWGRWLGETGAGMAELKALLVPYLGDLDMALQLKPPPRPGR